MNVAAARPARHSSRCRGYLDLAYRLGRLAEPASQPTSAQRVPDSIYRGEHRRARNQGPHLGVRGRAWSKHAMVEEANLVNSEVDASPTEGSTSSTESPAAPMGAFSSLLVS